MTRNRRAKHHLYSNTIGENIINTPAPVPVPPGVSAHTPEGADTWAVEAEPPNRPDCRPTLSSKSLRPTFTGLPALQYSVPSMYRAERRGEERRREDERGEERRGGEGMRVEGRGEEERSG